MARLIWLRSARADLREIHRYIARDSKVHAKAMVERIQARAERLVDFPESGRMVPEYGDPAIREVIVSPYRIVYRHIPEHDRVEVLRVFHSSMLLPDGDDG